MNVTYSDSGKFHTSSGIMKKHYQNGMEAKSSSTTTYQYDLNGNLLLECRYWDNPQAGSQVKSSTNMDENQLPVVPKRALDDTLHRVIYRAYDVNNNLIQALHSNSLDAEPFYQEHYEYDKNGQLIKSYQINGEGVKTGVTFVKYRKKGKNTEVISTKIVDQFLNEEQCVSLIDEYGHYLEGETLYDDVKIASYNFTYQQFGDRYQVEMKQYYDSNIQPVNVEYFPVYSETRWIYKRK
jgi:hypothetical protein